MCPEWASIETENRLIAWGPEWECRLGEMATNSFEIFYVIKVL